MAPDICHEHARLANVKLGLTHWCCILLIIHICKNKDEARIYFLAVGNQKSINLSSCCADQLSITKGGEKNKVQCNLIGTLYRSESKHFLKIHKP